MVIQKNINVQFSRNHRFCPADGAVYTPDTVHALLHASPRDAIISRILTNSNTTFISRLISTFPVNQSEGHHGEKHHAVLGLRFPAVLEEKNLQGYNNKLLSFDKQEHKTKEVTDLNPRAQVHYKLTNALKMFIWFIVFV